MGRGKGGYTKIQVWYKDSGGRKVTDRGAIFVAERYMDQGFEVVFRRHHSGRSYDLSIKSSDDRTFIKNIEVKKITSPSTSKIASRIKEGFSQFEAEKPDTVAIYLVNYPNCKESREFAYRGFNEAKRKGFIIGHVEIWFKDKTKMILN